jgi:hypothetical protein
MHTFWRIFFGIVLYMNLAVFVYGIIFYVLWRLNHGKR